MSSISCLDFDEECQGLSCGSFVQSNQATGRGFVNFAHDTERTMFLQAGSCLLVKTKSFLVQGLFSRHE